MRYTRYAVTVLLALSAWPAAAVITRHDVPASTYQKLGRERPGYCQLGLPDGGGVVIAPRWVLTAAHLAGDVKAGHIFTCAGKKQTVSRVFINPKFYPNVGRHDLALIELAAPSGVASVAIMRTPLSVGTVADLVGHYQGGTGLTGGIGTSPTGLRGATNRVSAVDDNWLRFVFDAPGTRGTTPFEGVSGAGDSGAPAYIRIGRRFMVIGVGSRSSDSNHDGIEQDYGDTDLYVPVASHLHWIERTMARGSSARADEKGAEEDVFEQLAEAGFSGVAVVYKDGRPVLERASGQANAHAPFTLETKVDIASLSKPITAMAIFQLIDRGTVSLTDTLGQWFSDVPADKQAVTVRQLLNHSSGLVDIPAGMTDYTPISEGAMQRRIFAEPLDFTPGSKNSYSNSGYNLLGMIVEKASGQSLESYLQQHIFRRAGVRASYDSEHFTASEVAGTVEGDTAQSVRKMAAARRGPFWGLWGAGGIFMSAPDVAKLFLAFHRGQIVTAASVERMSQDTVPAGSYASEGLGWTIIHTRRGDDFVSYTGSSQHSNSAIRYYPDGKLLVAVVGNSMSPGSVRVARELAQPVVGADFNPNPITPETPPLASADPADVAAIREFTAAVAGDPAERMAYVRSHFSSGYREAAGEQKLADKIGDLASIGIPKVISIYRSRDDTVMMFETQESEHPNLYELFLRRRATGGLIDKFEIARVGKS